MRPASLQPHYKTELVTEPLPVDTKNTQRQFYSDYYHPGGPSQADSPTNPPLL